MKFFAIERTPRRVVLTDLGNHNNAVIANEEALLRGCPKEISIWNEDQLRELIISYNIKSCKKS